MNPPRIPQPVRRPTPAPGHSRGLRRRSIAPLPLLLTLLAATAGTPAPASAQVDNLDDAEFIEGLRQRGMTDLLLYYIEANPPKDPVVKQRIAIEQHKLRFQKSDLSTEERRNAVDQALAAYRELFDQAPPDHPRRPIWRTDYVAYILDTALPARHVNATRFVEFGVPTAAQRTAFDRLIEQARQATDDAANEMFRLLGRLPRRDDFQTEFVNTGFWTTLRRDYGQLKLPYYRAHAHYFATLRSNPSGDLDRALELARSLTDRPLSASAEPGLHSLLGRILLKKGQPQQAIEQLDKAINHDSTHPSTIYQAQLAKSQALHQSDRTQEALDLIEKARQTERVSSDPMLLVLSYDREFKITDDQAVYDRLLASEAARPWRQQLERFVNKRFVADALDPQQMANEAPRVVLANIDSVLEQFARASDSSDAEAKKQAQQQLKAGRTVLQNLLERQGLSNKNRAQALLKLGTLEYRAGQRAAGARAWLKLAEDLPDQPPAQSGVVNAFLLTQALYKANQDNDLAIDLFDRAQQVLLNDYPSVEVGGSVARSHWHTRGNFLREQERWDDAIEAMKRVSADHPLHADALYQIVLCRFNQWMEAPAKEKAERAEAVVTAADRALPVLKEAIAAAAGPRANNRRYQRGDTLLRKAEAIAQDEPQRAVELLDGFDQRYESFPDLISAKRPLLVGILARQGKLAEAQQEIERLIEEFPERGGPIIQSTLNHLNSRIASRKDADQDWENLAEIGVELSARLVEWARQQPQYGNDPAKLLSFRITRGQQLITAERYQEAADLFQALANTEAGKNNIDVVHGQARALRNLGQRSEALSLINRILRLASDPEASLVWDSWVMRLQIRDHQYETAREAGNNEKAEEISTEIFTAIAKLKRRDENLGGSPHQQELERLSNKHFPN